jgi:hypothetical protein
MPAETAPRIPPPSTASATRHGSRRASAVEACSRRLLKICRTGCSRFQERRGGKAGIGASELTRVLDRGTDGVLGAAVASMLCAGRWRRREKRAFRSRSWVRSRSRSAGASQGPRRCRVDDSSRVAGTSRRLIGRPGVDNARPLEKSAGARLRATSSLPSDRHSPSLERRLARRVPRLPTARVCGSRDPSTDRARHRRRLFDDEGAPLGSDPSSALGTQELGVRPVLGVAAFGGHGDVPVPRFSHVSRLSIEVRDTGAWPEPRPEPRPPEASTDEPPRSDPSKAQGDQDAAHEGLGGGSTEEPQARGKQNGPDVEVPHKAGLSALHGMRRIATHPASRQGVSVGQSAVTARVRDARRGGAVAVDSLRQREQRLRTHPNRAATASLTFAILAIPCGLLMGVPAMVLGVVGLSRPRHRRRAALGLALGGVTSAAGLLVFLIAWAVLPDAVGAFRALLGVVGLLGRGLAVYHELNGA